MSKASKVLPFHMAFMFFRIWKNIYFKFLHSLVSILLLQHHFLLPSLTVVQAMLVSWLFLEHANHIPPLQCVPCLVSYPSKYLCGLCSHLYTCIQIPSQRGIIHYSYFKIKNCALFPILPLFLSFFTFFTWNVIFYLYICLPLPECKLCRVRNFAYFGLSYIYSTLRSA